MLKTLNLNSRGIKKFIFLSLVCICAFYNAKSQNAIVTENLNAGVPQSTWDIPNNFDGTYGDLSIQGFATDISVNKGSTINFKITVTSGTNKTYGIQIYRIGYYQGNGGRLIANLGSAFTGTTQNACIFDNATGLTDCGNWTTSASWTVPSTAVSGLYVAKLTRSSAGGGGSSHIAFVVRDDAGASPLFFKTSDATWQAYNGYGGYSLYLGPGLSFNHGKKVSYNRPFITRNGTGGGGSAEDWLLNAEYPMIRFLEKNGYDINYTTDLDIARNNASGVNLLLNHKVFLSVGHDEYWSAEERNSVEAARAAGKHLAFFSGNESYWKTRWENSVDGNNTPFRTMVCYKEGTLATPAENPCGGKCDLSTTTWTGLWRDGCGYPGVTDACKPENALSGEISWDGATGALQVPATYKNLRFWRNTAVASLGAGQTATMTPGTLGYEFDWEQYQGSYPPGRITMSSTVLDGHTHKLSLYKATSGALVFGAGSVQWAWGLDATHDRGTDPANPSMQQATVNVLADMGVQPGSLQTGLVAATASTDVTPPAVTINSPANGTVITSTSPVTISGTATDAGTIASVEVSTDGGVSWTPANGTSSWSFSWTPTVNGTYSIKVRGIDDSGNYASAATATTVTVTVNFNNSQNCPCNIFGAAAPNVITGQDNTTGIVLGTKFRTNANGTITGIRFYKASANTGTHTGLLYNTAGVLLAQATFSGETASGWQQVNFSTPVSITGGQTYVAAYLSSAGFYSFSDAYFTQAITNGPISALADGTDGANGLYQYSSTPIYPANSFQQSNYWVDAVFTNGTSANAGVNQIITLPVSTVTLNGSGSSGNITSYGWTMISGPNTPTITTPTAVTTTVTGLIQGTYIFQLSINGGASLSQVTITVNPVPPPVAKAGAKQTITLPVSTVTLDGSGSSGTITSYSWSFVSGPASPTIVSPTTVTTSVTGLIQGTYIFQLSVNGGVSTARDTVVVNPVPPPTANAGTNQTIVLPASTCTLNGAGSTGTITSYSWTQISGPNTSSITTPTSVSTSVTGLIQGTYIFQLSVNAGVSTAQITVSVVPAVTTTTIFTTQVAPTGTGNDGTALELGVKFRTSIAGFVTGIRFYKTTGNTGTHTGELYSSSGTRLAQAVFTGETASGWQQVLFSSPVAITANTTYIAAYFSAAGNYTGTSNYFTSALVNGSVTALADGTDGNNGLFRYTTTPAVPNSAFQKSNYWVDLVFSSTPPPPVANAGANQTITLPTSGVTLNGSASSGTISSYAWTLISGPNTPTITTPAAVTTTVTGLIQGTYVFQLSLNNGASTSRVTITVNPIPPPTANAGANQTITLPVSSVMLNGNASTGTISSYTWTLVSGPNTPVITTPAAVTTTVTGLIQGTYIFQLSLNGGASTSQVTITVNPIPPPSANAGANQSITLPVSSVTLNGSASTGTISSYLWTQVSGPNTAVITSPTTVSTSVTGLIQGSYIFQLALNGGVSLAQVTITVNAAPPPTANAGANQNISSPATSATLNGSASTGIITSYNWTQISGPNSATITTPTAVSTTVTGLILGTYTFQLSVNGGVSVAQTIVNVVASTTYTIFTTQTPTVPTLNDGQALELGVKFRSSVAGFVTGIRFYKTSGNSGTHTGELYTSTGTRLAQAVFTGETTTGWQSVLFSSPVAITAGITYIASYFSAAGNYSGTSNYFTTSVVNGPISGLADGIDGNNGLFRYTTTPAVPNSAFQKSNYWVDVIFNGTFTSSDVTPPTIVVASPAAGATGTQLTSKVNLFFSEKLDASSVNNNTVFLQTGSTLVPSTVTYNATDSSAMLTPSSPLTAGALYKVTVKGGTGANKIKDPTGNALAADSIWNFTANTPITTNPANGPGGPILLISSTANPFSRYPVEILRAEGWNAFAALDITAVTTTELNKYDAVILGDIILTPAQVSMLSDWVTAGGTLVAFHPDPQLAGLMGISPAGGTLANQYLLVNTTTGPGVGIVNQTIQFHGSADLYTVNAGTNILATLYSGVSTATVYPAVTSRNVGTLGGQAIAFTYDLAKSVVYTRQGNPAWAGQKRDGNIPAIRSDDLFYGNASFDPQPDWVNLNKVAIPQADEQQRLLTNIILAGNFDRKPLPRFWFLPKGKTAAVVMTGDDHANGGTAGRFSQYLSLSSSNTASAVANWDAIRSSSYIYPTTPISNAQIANFQNLGFEVSIHLDPECTVWTPADLNGYFDDQLSDFFTNYYTVNKPSSHRIHCLTWSDWATLPKTELQRGIRLNVSYYYWPDVWINNRPGMFTGSGMPMRFADTDGSLIDNYQVPSQMTDESGQDYPLTINALLNNATGPLGYYGVFAANMHTDLAASDGSDDIIASAQNLQIPVVSGKQMLDWLDGRNNSTFSNYTWTNNQLGFTVIQDPKALNLKGMLPQTIAAGSFISLTLNGSAVNTTIQTIKGVSYVFFDAVSGNYVATYGVAAPGSTGPHNNMINPTLDSAGVNQNYYLGQNYPNPFYQNTRINYSIPVSGVVELILYDMQGRPVKQMVNGMKEAGSYAYDLNTATLEKGVYFYRMRSANFTDVKKLIIK